jgi:hypothetical protein
MMALTPGGRGTRAAQGLYISRVPSLLWAAQQDFRAKGAFGKNPKIRPLSAPWSVAGTARERPGLLCSREACTTERRAFRISDIARYGDSWGEAGLARYSMG